MRVDGRPRALHVVEGVLEGAAPLRHEDAHDDGGGAGQALVAVDEHAAAVRARLADEGQDGRKGRDEVGAVVAATPLIVVPLLPR